MKQSILFRLTPNHLIVANTGKVFTKKGFEAICYTDTSAKKSNHSQQALSEKDAQSWISNVLQKKRNTFSDFNQLQSAGATEQRTAKDYADRLILELIQNAIDAGIDEQIGYKGIGIRSVLNESQEFEIHSGNLHVRWSEKDAIDLLKGLGELPGKLPILDLPAWSSPDGEIKKVLSKNYQTVIRLALTDIGRQRVEEEWKKFSDDPSLLLFIDSDIDVRWEYEGCNPVQWSRNNTGEFVTIEVNCGNNDPKKFYWLSIGSKDVRAAYAVDERKRFKHSEEPTPRLCSFFPAAQSPHPFPNMYLHHAKFELHSNRQSIVFDKHHLQEMAKVITLAVKTIENEADLLDLLHVNQIDSKDMNRSETQLWRVIQPMLVREKLKGLGGRCLADIKSCLSPNKDDLPYDWWHKNRWRAWEAFLAALKKERPTGLSDLPVLNPGTENDTREKTLLTFNPECSFKKEEIQKLNWAPVGSLNAPVSSHTIKIFLSLQELDLRPPNGIKVQFLSPAFVKEFKDNTSVKVEKFLETILGVQKFSALGVIKHCVLPVLSLNQTSAATIELIEFLKSLLEADKEENKKPVESFNWKDPTRCNLTLQLQLQCQGILWPVFRIYAGQKWTGNEYLENTYGKDRGFLEMEPPENEKERKDWEVFWKWLGIGWRPKVMPLLENVINKPGDFQGLNWNDGVFQGSFFQKSSNPDAWSNYCSDLQKDDSFKNWQYNPRIKSNWTIDGGHEVLTKQDTFNIIGTNWSTYKEWIKADVCISSNMRDDNDNVSKFFQSYLAWLIKSIFWIPTTGTSLYQGKDVFLQDSPVVAKIPQFVAALRFTWNNEQGKNKFPIEFIKCCGIRSHWNFVEDSDWRLWLKAASEMGADSNGSTSNRDAIHSLYRALLDNRKLKTGPKNNEQPIKPLSNISLWGIERSDGIKETWKLHKPNNHLPYFIDRGDLADVMLTGLYVFPVRLDGLTKKAAKHFNIEALSKVLSGELTSDGDLLPKYSTSVRERINELVAYLRIGNTKLSDDELREALHRVTLRQVTELHVQFSLNGSPINEEVSRTQFHKKNNDQSWTIFVDESLCSSDDRRWEAFAETLLLSCGLDVDRRKEVRDLLQYKIEELPGELLRLGVAPETVQDLQQTNQARDMELEETPFPTSPQITTAPILETKINIEPKTIIQPDSGSQNKDVPNDGEKVRKGLSKVPTGRNKLPNYNSIHPPSHPHPEEGMKAQEWLFLKIKNWCQLQGLQDPIWEQDYVDITILLNSPVLIEVKRIEGRTVHWSSNQIEKAYSFRNTYVLALLRPHKDEKYEIFWALDPINEFKTLSSRYIEWVWKVQKGADFGQISWEKPESPPLKKANSYNAVISLTDEWTEKLPKGLENGLKLISNLLR